MIASFASVADPVMTTSKISRISTTQLSDLKPRENSFVLFPCLPTELRLRIYTYSLPDSRLVPLLSKSRGSLSHESHQLHNIICSHVIPPLLHVCREARHLAKQFYSPLFHLLPDPLRGCNDGGESDSKNSATVWWRNDRSDIALLGPLSKTMIQVDQFDHFKNVIDFLNFSDLREISKIRRVAISETLFTNSLRCGSCMISAGGLTDLCLREFWLTVLTRLPDLIEVLFINQDNDSTLSNMETIMIPLENALPSSPSRTSFSSTSSSFKPLRTTPFQRQVAHALDIVLNTRLHWKHVLSWRTISNEQQLNEEKEKKKIELPSRRSRVGGYFGGPCHIAKLSFLPNKDVSWWGLYEC